MSNTEQNRIRTRSLMAGLIVLVVGVALLMNVLSISFFPSWLFNWPSILIVVGIIAGIKSRFENPGWLILIIIGSVFMLSELHIFSSAELWKFAPAIGVISVGLLIVIRAFSPRTYRPHRHWNRWQRWQRRYERHYRNEAYDNSQENVGGGFSTASGDDQFDIVNVFGASKRRVFSKKFKGGESVNFFGGTNLDLTQADIEGEAVLDVVCIFGGVKLIVPSNWKIESQITTIMGGVEDKRSESPAALESDKRLIITGVCIFGGIEIKNFY